ncbi:MAG TPA: hypothetical protein VNU97_01645 [Rhizomicrobium sp.]|jgi:hypothetical protein|nr:hypothetical protein [Rhizomicrobium sp.]
MANQDNNRTQKQDMGTRRQPEQQDQSRDTGAGKQGKSGKPDQNSQAGQTRRANPDQGARH